MIWKFMVDVPAINNLFSTKTLVVCPICGRDKVLCHMSKEYLSFSGIRGFAFDLNRRFTHLL